ncbi:hypothetical protein K2X33_00435 [bacterium]|nr:hypothetical protein [bacterium]
MNKITFEILDLLRRESTAPRISAGATLGFLFGLTPWGTLQSLVLVILLLVTCYNPIAFLASAVLFSGLFWAFAPLLSMVGTGLLVSWPSLYPLWTWASHTPILALTGCNYTVVLGAFAVTGVLAVPFYWLVKLTVLAYGERILSWSRYPLLRYPLKQISWSASKMVKTYVQRENQA